jgi:rod shape-determining protein MreC
MNDLLKLILKSHFLILFLILESVSIYLSVRNTEKASIFISSANSISGFFYEKVQFINNYFSLKSQNELLVKENEKLKNFIAQNKISPLNRSESIEQTGFFYIAASVINNSVQKPHNILTINKGKSNQIHENMAVISDNGIVGVVSVVGNNYSTVISILNSSLGISAKLERTGFYGTLKWDEEDYRYSILYDIPDHSSVYVGDKIVSSGYSAIFPEGIPIGTVASYEKIKETSFYRIKVKLSQDLKNLNHVYLIDYFGRDEQIKIQDSTILKYQF